MNTQSFLLRFLILIVIGSLLSCIENPPEEDPKPPMEEEPSGIIDLTHWYLTIPVDEDGNGNSDIIEQPELNKYQTNTSILPYMYDGTDSSLVFYCPYTGNATPNSSYSRTELREQMTTGSNNNNNWIMEEGGIMKGVLSVPDMSAGHRTIIMQIHGRLTNAQRDAIGQGDNDAPPLLKIYHQNNKIRVLRKVMVDPSASDDALLLKTAWKDDVAFYFDEGVATDKFDLEVIASDGRLEVKMNDESVVFDDESMQRWSFENYFKAGNYLQSRDVNAYAEVRYYELTVTH